MELKTDYKQTAIEMIPKDWDVLVLGSHVEIKSGESPSLFRFESEGTPYFKVEQLNNNSKYLRDTEYFFSGIKKIPHGSLIFPKRGASILLNKIRILEQDSFMDTNLMTLTVGASIHNEYLYYALTHIELWRIADTTSIPQINNKHIIPLAIPFPPTKAEQEAIAEALSDADALIEALEHLIAKKCQLKQGAMQELLTGKHRLPGFGGEWEVKSISELAGGDENIVDGPFGSNLIASDYILQGIPVLQGLNVTGDKFTWRDIRYISEQKAKELFRSNAQVGDLLTVKIGSVGFSALIHHLDVHNFAIIPANLLRLRIKAGETDARFVHWLLISDEGKRKLRDLAGNTAQPAIGLSGFRKLCFAVPKMLEEQTAIAQILSDMDTEIAGLESKLAKSRAVKQGMMQQLLTGRIRLV